MRMLVGSRQSVAEAGDHAADADAADLLVVGQRDVQRHLQRRRAEPRRMRQNAGDEALHVGAAAAIEAPRCIVAAQHERIARPALAGHRHDIGVSRQGDPAIARGPDRREQVGLRLCRIENAGTGDSVTVEPAGDEFDQRKVRLRRSGVEGDKPFQQGDRRRERFGRHRINPARKPA
jgi:hypothetical protein